MRIDGRRLRGGFGTLDLVRLQVDFLDPVGIAEARQERGLAAGDPFAARAGGDRIRQADGDHARHVVRLPALCAADEGHARMIAQRHTLHFRPSACSPALPPELPHIASASARNSFSRSWCRRVIIALLIVGFVQWRVRNLFHDQLLTRAEGIARTVAVASDNAMKNGARRRAAFGCRQHQIACVDRLRRLRRRGWPDRREIAGTLLRRTLTLTPGRTRSGRYGWRRAAPLRRCRSRAADSSGSSPTNAKR